LKQEEAAKRLKISQPTFSRIVGSAHDKVADTFLDIKTIWIEGGAAKLQGGRSE